MENNSIFNANQIKKLDRPLAQESVKKRKGGGKDLLSYLAGYQVISTANEIFGYGNWSTEIMHIQQVNKEHYEKPPYNAGDEPKKMVTVAYTCQLKLSVRASGASEWVSHEDIGFGDGVSGDYALNSSIELATKEAVTDAIKRCFRYYGNQFGLTLYDKDDAPLYEHQIDAAQVVSEDQLTALRNLYKARDIDDEWVMIALKAESYPESTLEAMRQDWYKLAMQLVGDYKRDELERASYDADIANCTRLMNESGTFNMLKAVFADAFRKTGKYQDKQAQEELTALYEQKKAELTGDTK